MQIFFSKLIIEVEDQLQFIANEFQIQQTCAEESYKVVYKAYQNLQAFVIKYKFKTQQEEINYFKIQKPKLTSKLIYFGKMYHIETNKPQGTQKSKKKYLVNELDKIKNYFDNNIDFIRYYRSCESYLDYKYFLRNKIDFRQSHESFCIELDKKQSTSFDFKVAKIIANDQLQVYLHKQLKFLEYNIEEAKTPVLPHTKVTWMDSKTALIELIYSLHSQGTFGNQTDIKEIAEYFEKVFNIDLGDYYKTYLEIRIRKSSRTKFLDTLKENLLKRMNNSDDFS